MGYGFIILRHVNSVVSNCYWIECYERIRRFYPEYPIVIIDDHSDKNFLSSYPVENTQVVWSEFESRGEILPYYMFSRNNWFDYGIIIHDSVFIQEYVDFTTNNVHYYGPFHIHGTNQPKKQIS